MNEFWSWVFAIAICLIFLSMILFSQLLKSKSVPKYMPQNRDLSLKLEIELAKFLTSRGLSLESVTPYVQKFCPLKGAIKLAIFDAIQSLPSDTNFEEELSKLIFCGQYYPDGLDEIETLIYHIPFCTQYLATIRPLDEAEKRSVCKLIESILDECSFEVTDQSREELITLLRTLTPDRIGQAKNPEEEKPIVSSSPTEDKPATEVAPQFELEMRRG